MCFFEMASLCYGACIFVRDFRSGLSQFTKDGVDVQNGRERTTTYVWTIWNLISLATCIFNVVDFASLQGAFSNFVTQVLPTSSLRIKWSWNACCVWIDAFTKVYKDNLVTWIPYTWRQVRLILYLSTPASPMLTWINTSFFFHSWHSRVVPPKAFSCAIFFQFRSTLLSARLLLVCNTALF